MKRKVNNRIIVYKPLTTVPSCRDQAPWTLKTAEKLRQQTLDDK